MAKAETANGVRCVTGETPLQAAINAREDANRDVVETLRKEYPVDAGIRWVRAGSGRVYFGKVKEHLHGERIRVRNSATRKIVDIYAWQVARAEHRNA